jgi:hypothetical protein
MVVTLQSERCRARFRLFTFLSPVEVCMQITVERTTKTANSTEGKLSVDGVFQCYTLEPTYREVIGQPVSSWKIPGRTAIPAGTYALEVTYFQPHSGGEGYYAPLLDNVPGFIGIRIHIGNFPKDTEGCILVGTATETDDVLNSGQAFVALMTKINAARTSNQPISISVI